MHHTIARFARLSSCVVVAAVGLGAGCTTTIEVPDRFLVTENWCGEVRALTPEESKLWIREFPDSDKGSLAFWGEALQADLVKSRGYTLIESVPVKDAAGREGLSLVLETTLSGRPVREFMAVFVLPGWFENTIRVVEYVADKETFAGEVDGVRASLATLR